MLLLTRVKKGHGLFLGIFILRIPPVNSGVNLLPSRTLSSLKSLRKTFFVFASTKCSPETVRVFPQGRIFPLRSILYSSFLKPVIKKYRKHGDASQPHRTPPRLALALCNSFAICNRVRIFPHLSRKPLFFVLD
ncbi:hypothetical protein Pint_20060 [Pistacia integerrima]|uniref:Uncharacterized protein n=1 Tax=Pistacia integerrima TaxID=434235 RepID=A0ACC0X7D1_9ROSI|nr:hypothetical protein Pint_20060 [Pistacia integerrima]